MSVPVQWDTLQKQSHYLIICVHSTLCGKLFSQMMRMKPTERLQIHLDLFLLEKQLTDTPCCYQVLPSQLTHLATDRSQWNIDYNRIFATKTRPVEFVSAIKLQKSAMNLLQRQSPVVSCSGVKWWWLLFWFLQFWNLPTIASELEVNMKCHSHFSFIIQCISELYRILDEKLIGSCSVDVK